MAGKCKNSETLNDLPDKFKFKARVYDFDPSCYEEGITEITVAVEMIDYKTGHIWYSNGMRSVNFELIPLHHEQEPRVLTLEEVKQRIGKPLWIKDLVCGEIECMRFQKIYQPYGYNDLDYRFEQFGTDVGVIRWEGKYGAHWLAFDRQPEGE